MEKPPVEPPQPPPERDDVKLAVSRCPYCRDDVAAEGSAVCEGCLTRHHPACWDEAARCSSCGSTSRLQRAQPGQARGPIHDPEWYMPPPAPVQCVWVGCERPNTWSLGAGPARWCEEHARSKAALRLLILLVVSALLAIPGALLIALGVASEEYGLLVLGVLWLCGPAYVIYSGLKSKPREHPAESP